MVDSGVLIAVVGVGGTLTASITTGVLSNRAQRRSEEAREREQARQLEAAKDERTHAVQAERQVWLRERRETAYGDYLAAVHSARTAIGPLYRALSTDTTPVTEIRDHAEAATLEVRAAFRFSNRVLLMGPTSAASAGGAYLECLRNLWADLNKWARIVASDGALADDDKTLMKLRFNRNTVELVEAEARFTEAARAALES
ncbi:hypothetical protein [Kitasatospora herbaricolor]|uniref:hypothetical protein n=1 Tax=Kitasatospora herbaricolor TaxID=68217 RepID=UPI0036D95729